MKINEIILVDCDLVMADVAPAWKEWLEQKTGVYVLPQPNMYYDLTLYFREELEELGMTGFEFWDNPKLYTENNIKPVEGAYEALQRLSLLGATLVPVSKDMGAHGPDKRLWIEKHFPFMEECILTSNKHFVKGDIIIEDRMQNLQGFKRGEIYGIILNTPYLEPCSLDCSFTICDNWQQIEDEFNLWYGLED